MVAQTNDAAQVLINNVNKKFSKVKDYQADAVINTRISFLKILPQKAKIFFKQPDKFHVKSQGIAILPKQNFGNLLGMLSKEGTYIAVISGVEQISNSSTTIVNVIPNADTTDLILARLWIDPIQNLILKSQLTTRTNGTLLIEYEHLNYINFGVPDKITFTIEVKKFKIPKAVSADINSNTTKTPTGKEPKTGKIIISLSNYVFNKGIDDNIFK
jgi:outer membrane lipoprotein-sorting protein